MENIRVLFLVPSLARAGAEKQVVELANGLANIGFDCHLASFESNRDQLDRIDRTRVTYHHLVRRGKFDLALIGQIATILDRENIEILHCTLNMALFFGSLAARKSSYRPRVVAGVHTTISPSRKEDFLLRYVYRNLFRSSDRVIFVCRRQMEYWVARDPAIARNGVVIYNGVDLTEFDRQTAEPTSMEIREGLGIPDSATTICCIAAFRPEKVQGNIIIALAKLKETHPETHLLLAGEGPERKRVEQVASNSGIGERVHFLGSLSDVRPVLAVSRFSLISSIAVETFSFAMLESMAMGTPVISTRIGGAEEAIITKGPGATGKLVQPGDVEELAMAMNDLLTDSALANQYGLNARRLVEKLFTREKMVNETASLLLRVHQVQPKPSADQQCH